MIEIVAFLLIVISSAFIVRAGSVALAMTGLSPDVASFQSWSAFTGTGFTTKESETIVGHAVRRRIVKVLMLCGNAGLFSALAALVVGLTQHQGEDLRDRLLAIVVGLGVLLLLSNVAFLNRLLNAVLQRLFARIPGLRIRDYEELLRVDKGFAISHVRVEPDSWLAGHALRELAMISEGVIVLSIERATGAVLATPGPLTRLHEGDTVLCYGKELELEQLGHRPAGPAGAEQHRLAVERQRLRRAEESVHDPEVD